MIIDVREGASAPGFRPNTINAAFAQFLNSFEVGQSKTITQFIDAKGAALHYRRVQTQLPSVKPVGTDFISRSTPEGGLTVERLK